MTTSNPSHLSRAAINAAVQRGEQARNTRLEQEARGQENATRRQAEAATQRAAEILDGLPLSIAQLVSEADETPQTVIVMWVEPYEYDGETERYMGIFDNALHQGQPESLKLAARHVYDALAELSPQLVYKPKKVLSCTGQLAIVIRLS